MRDLIEWEPGETVTCVLCGKERGGDVPPGNWQRDYVTMRRRVPIWGAGPVGPLTLPLGYLEYFRP